MVQASQKLKNLQKYGSLLDFFLLLILQVVIVSSKQQHSDIRCVPIPLHLSEGNYQHVVLSIFNVSEDIVAVDVASPDASHIELGEK